MQDITDYIRVNTIKEALKALQTSSKPTHVLAGGTDLLLKLNGAEGDHPTLIDISNVGELNGIQKIENGLRIGATTKLKDIVQSDLLKKYVPIIPQSAVKVGSVQIRNLATIGGNICNASPSADTATPLIVMDSIVELISLKGSRLIPLAKFFVGPGKTVLGEDEILTAIHIPKQPPGANSIYLKHTTRGAMDLAIVGVAVQIALIDGCHDVRIGLGAVAPTPMRSRKAEIFLSQVSKIGDKEINEAAHIAEQESKPISDIRASAKYRRDMVRVLTERALRKVLIDLIQS